MLTNFHWPGNIRQLQNCIERSVIRTAGPALELCQSEFLRDHPRPAVTLEDAQRLGLARTTLIARMQKLDIRRPGITATEDGGQRYSNGLGKLSHADGIALHSPTYH
jgi:transcriptional regulator with GAF, ATPase, and Fis domain